MGVGACDRKPCARGRVRAHLGLSGQSARLQTRIRRRHHPPRARQHGGRHLDPNPRLLHHLRAGGQCQERRSAGCRWRWRQDHPVCRLRWPGLEGCGSDSADCRTLTEPCGAATPRYPERRARRRSCRVDEAGDSEIDRGRYGCNRCVPGHPRTMSSDSGRSRHTSNESPCRSDKDQSPESAATGFCISGVTAGYRSGGLMRERQLAGSEAPAAAFGR